MKDEIKEISKADKKLLDKIEYILGSELSSKEYDVFYNYFNEIRKPNILIDIKDDENIKDYITNLQEKSNNQAEEINRLYKQREKFMKKYGYLKEENESLKQLCNKYEKEHSTTFNEWKETITDKYQTLKDLQEENESLKKRNKEIYDGFLAVSDERCEYAIKCEKAIEYIDTLDIEEYDGNSYYIKDKTGNNNLGIEDIPKNIKIILNGGDEE